MTLIHNDPGTFVADAIDGLVLAHPNLVRRVDGGVVRATTRPPGQVAVVIGGGSGHYPAFSGLVGPGLAAGAVCGEVFTSPSAAQAYRVAHASHRNGGVLFIYGNYAGDVLHFGIAQDRLRAEGMDVRTVLVTDDIASAPRENAFRRRGIAGDFVVTKLAGAAAEAGEDLDTVERVAREANARTFTLGIGLRGCTLPGSEAPLFEVPPGLMSIGLGIHGEPGIRDEPLASAHVLAAKLVTALIEEAPSGLPPNPRVAVVVNGLGTVKYEELYLLYKSVAAELGGRGITVVEPEVGELVTSLDMGGVSLTLCWLDDDLLDFWRAPATSPAYTKPGAPAGIDNTPLDTGRWSEARIRLEGSPSAVVANGSALVVDALRVAVDTIEEREAELGALDSKAGDGDHGSGMRRGLRAALGAAEAEAEGGAAASEVLVAAGRAWAEHGAGTSGALWGASLERAGRYLHAVRQPSASDFARTVTAGLDAVRSLGGAEVGDKTLIDAFAPFAAELERLATQGEDFGAAWATSARRAHDAALRTAELVPRLGRARPLAERSKGHPDPGAMSFAYLALALGDHFQNEKATP